MPEIGQIKEDIGELKVNVSHIKDEVHDMKKSITTAVEKISNSMTTLASVSEKLNQNVLDHQNLTDRIDDLEDVGTKLTEQVNEHSIELRAIKGIHLACVEQKRMEEEKKKNSFINRAKDKVTEYIFIVLMALTVYVLVTHFQKFVLFMTGTGQGLVLPK